MPRSIEQIKNDHPTVDALRKEAARIGVSRVIREGEKLPVFKGRKDELVEAISKREVFLETKKSTTESISPVEVTPVEIEVIDISEREQEIIDVTKRYYTGFKNADGSEIVGIRNFAKSQIDKVQQNLPMFDARLFTTVATFKNELTIMASDFSKTGEVNAGTLLNLRGFILKTLEKYVKAESNQFEVVRTVADTEIKNNYLQESFEAFRFGVIASFSQVAREKRVNQGVRFTDRSKSAPHAKVLPLIDWAVNRLKKLPIESKLWREVALAILIVTGRRPAEVLATGVFKAINATDLEFYGQLKKKGELNDETVYRIPAIGDTAQEVETAIKWLEMMNKRVLPKTRSLEDKQASAKKSHDRFSRYLSEIADSIMPSRLTLNDGATWELSEDRSRIKPYLARQIYLQILSKRADEKGKSMSINSVLVIAYLSGHYLSIDGKDSSAENYKADINIEDLDAIAKYWNWSVNLTEDELNSIKAK
jgi:Telomere resolvase